jgi:hypothetical protein
MRRAAAPKKHQYMPCREYASNSSVVAVKWLLLNVEVRGSEVLHKLDGTTLSFIPIVLHGVNGIRVAAHMGLA